MAQYSVTILVFLSLHVALAAPIKFVSFLLGYLKILVKTPQMSPSNLNRRIHGSSKFAPACALRDSRDKVAKSSASIVSQQSCWQ